MTALTCSDWEVRAWLDGRRREFRRPIKELAGAADSFEHQLPNKRNVPHPRLGLGVWMVRGAEKPIFIPCPYAPGSRLVVKETWSNEWKMTTETQPVVYRADGLAFDADYRWSPPQHMPAWASRLTLLVTACRAERLQEINHEGALAEGLSWSWLGGTVIDHFQYQWDSRYGKRPGLAWADNPWVWVTSCEVAPCVAVGPEEP